MLKKNQLRRLFAIVRNNLTLSQRQAKAAQIKEQLCRSTIWQTSSHIAAYSAVGAEVDTKPIIEQGWLEGKTIYLPKTDPQDRKLFFYQVTPQTVLMKGAYGILEPTGKEQPLKLEELECILIPGLMFDLWGYRLGSGGGYYDRFLPQLSKHTVKIGLAYHCQLFPSPMPRDRFDQPVDLVITEKQVVNCVQKRSKGKKA